MSWTVLEESLNNKANLICPAPDQVRILKVVI